MVLLDCMVCEARFTCGVVGQGGHSLTTLKRLGRQGAVVEMSTISTFFFIQSVKECLLINVNSWVNRWSENAKILSTQFVNDPWPKNLCNVVVSGPQIICIWQAHLQLWQDTKVKSFGLSPTYCAVTQCNSILIWRNF